MSIIVFTGGGTAGHVTPNLALIERFKEEGWETHYIGSAIGPESSMIPSECCFHAVASGKLRRYFSWQNFIDPFKMLWGIAQSWGVLKKTKAQVVFSKGGFVAFPVVVAAWLQRIPVIAHESDFSPGLANRLSYPFARKICLTFEAAKKYFSNQSRLLVTGTPIRDNLAQGQQAVGFSICGFDNQKPVLLMIGGSQGASALNTVLRQALPQLINDYQVVHICGKGKIDDSFVDQKNYRQFEFISDGLPHIFSISDIVISRAGANSLYELLALQKPHLLIPLSKKVSRGDQLENARYFSGLGTSELLEEDLLDAQSLVKSVHHLANNKDEYIEAMKMLNIHSATDTIVDIIKDTLAPLSTASSH